MNIITDINLRFLLIILITGNINGRRLLFEINLYLLLLLLLVVAIVVLIVLSKVNINCEQ